LDVFEGIEDLLNNEKTLRLSTYLLALGNSFPILMVVQEVGGWPLTRFYG
jgi:hypothetical protein